MLKEIVEYAAGGGEGLQPMVLEAVRSLGSDALPRW